MTRFTDRLACVRCGADASTAAPWEGCGACAERGHPANILPVYDRAPGPLPVAEGQPGIFRHRDLLPIPADATPVSLHEGNTPLVAAPALADEVGVARLWFKDETRNPTWSYKDRLAAVAITEARARGADTVALATTGNHGAAAAAYAAAAGMRCVALTLTSVPQTMKVLMQSYGATVVALDQPTDRWALLRQAVASWGWVPVSGFVDPPIGSNPFGVDGYKSIAYEVVEDLGDVPDAVVVPVAYGDGLVGILRGFEDLRALGLTDRVPRMVAAEPFGPYAAALAAGSATPVRTSYGPSVSFSVATPISTQQGLEALRASNGLAAAEPDDEVVMAAQRRIAGSVGLYLEASSSLCLPVVERLRRADELGPDATVVCIATSTGLKDVGASAARLPEVPTIAPRLSELAAVAGAT